MRYPSLERPAESHIPAVFTTGVSSFDMPCAATFEDLADRLSQLGARYGGPLTSLSLEAGSSALPQSIRTATLRRLAEAGGAISRAVF